MEEWTFTRLSKSRFAEGPWAPDDEATVTYHPNDRRVRVEGTCYVGSAGDEVLPTHVEFTDGILRIDVGVAEPASEEDRVVLGVIPRNHYRFDATFHGDLPARIVVRHLQPNGHELLSEVIDRPDG